MILPSPAASPRTRRTAARATLAGAMVAALAIPLLGHSPAEASPAVSAKDAGVGAKGCGAPLFTGMVKASEAARTSPSEFGEAAARNGKDRASFARHAADGAMRLDACGRTLYVEESLTKQQQGAGTAGAATAAAAAVGTAPTPTPDQAFALSSRPGSNRTLYLDFDGDTTTGSAWNSATNGTTFTSPAYDSDGAPASFSTAERTEIVRAWQAVAEDYAPFDVNVTTQDPGLAAIDRSSSTDLVFGTRVVITPSNPVYVNNCGSGCGGIAYVNVFTSAGSNHLYYQPAFVFTGGVGNGGKNIAEAASHEAGHNFGLSHDGTSTAGYYGGANGWAPIMGVGYSQPLSQWSNGQYADGNQKQDDLAIIATGAAVIADEAGPDLATAGSLSTAAPADGVISSPGDVDGWKFVAAGSTTVTASVATAFANLDTGLTIRDAAGAVVVQSDPVMARVSSSVASGLDASATFTAPAGGATYLAQVDGVANAASGTDYGSLGAYSVALRTQTPTSGTPLTATAATLPAGTVGAAYGPAATATASGGVAPYAYTASATPPGLVLDGATGAFSGTPTRAGTYPATITVTDAYGATAQVAVSVQVDSSAVTVAAQSTSGTAGTALGYQLRASGGDGTATYTWTTGAGLPSGLTVSSSGLVSGTTTATGTFSASVTASNGGRTGTGTLTLTIAPAATPLAFTTASALPSGKVRSTYRATIATSGGTPALTWSRTSGSVPSGTSLAVAADGRSVVLSGTPTRAGTYAFTLSVRDAAGTSTSRTFSVVVAR